MPRELRYHRKFKQGAGEGVLDIPHIGILRHVTPQQLIEEFKESWGVEPKAVVLPVTAPDGLLFDCQQLGLPDSKYKSGQDHFKTYEQTVFEFARLGCDIYLLLDPTLPFVQIDALHIVDIVSDSSAQVCIGNERAQEIAAVILGAGIDLVLEQLTGHESKLVGTVIDTVDLWPMGATDGRIEATCFCESCMKFFKPEEDLIRRLKDFPNALNLALADRGSGIGYIDAIDTGTTSVSLVSLSRLKGFLGVFGEDVSAPNLSGFARDLLKYIRLRHNQTVQALHNIFTMAYEGLVPEFMAAPPKRVVLGEGVYYNWTGGLQLQRLDSTDPEELDPFDEIWFDCKSSDMLLSEIPFRAYMWRRARYFIDALFSFTANAADPDRRATTGIGRFTEDQIKELARDRLNTAIGTTVYGTAALSALPPLKPSDDEKEEEEDREAKTETAATEEQSGPASQRVGFVGVGLTREIGEKFIDGLEVPPGKFEHQLASLISRAG